LHHTIKWRDWSPSAFADAAAARKPILLTLVTAWSDACAAMDEGAYQQSDVQEVIERRYVAVRVDADRRPDLNERYNLGGWPTTAILTPDGYVLNGGTYLDADELLALLTQVADAWRDRAEEIRERIRVEKVRLKADTTEESHADPGSVRLQPDQDAIAWFRTVLVDEYDAIHGGFGTGPKSPHVPAMRLAMALADEQHDATLRQIVEVTLGAINELWDPVDGGFYRYADEADWSRPSTEKTLEDNAALLTLLLDASVRLNSGDFRERTADLISWVRRTLANEDGGFFNGQAAVSRAVDRAMYVDSNADMIGAFMRASALLDDSSLRDFALKSLETVVVPGYVPGQGVAHEHAHTYVGRALLGPLLDSKAPGPEGPGLRTHGPGLRTGGSIRGLLGDQIRVTSALLWAHQITGQLPYSMLAAEVMLYAIRAMWDNQAMCFRDREDTEAPLWPFGLNCEAACQLDRLSVVTGDRAFRDRAVRILGTFAQSYRSHGLFAGPYALAIREVMEGRRIPDLKLSPVDWHLDED
jgi:uncharacterized protein YyaL (SSP411 family)